MPEISKTASLFNQSFTCLPFAVWLSWLFTRAWCCFYLCWFFFLFPPRSWSLRLTCHQETPRDTSLWQSTTASLSRVKAQWWQGLFFLGLLALVTMWRFLPWRWVSHFYSPQFSWWKETLNKEESVLFQSEIIQLFSVSVCCWFFSYSTISQLVMGRDIEIFK